MRTLGVPLPVTMYDIDSPGSNVNLLDSVMFPPVGHRIEWTTTPELASTVAVVDVVSTHTSAAFVVALYGVSEEVRCVVVWITTSTSRGWKRIQRVVVIAVLVNKSCDLLYP